MISGNWFSNVQFAGGWQAENKSKPSQSGESPISLRTERCHQLQFEQMAHYHTERVLPQRKWPSIWQQHQRCPFQLLSHFLWSFLPRIIGADKGGQDYDRCRLEPSINMTAMVDSDGKSLGNDYITPPLPAELIPSEKSLSEVRAVLKITTFSHSEYYWQGNRTITDLG